MLIPSPRRFPLLFSVSAAHASRSRRLETSCPRLRPVRPIEGKYVSKDGVAYDPAKLVNSVRGLARAYNEGDGELPGTCLTIELLRWLAEDQAA